MTGVNFQPSLGRRWLRLLAFAVLLQTSLSGVVFASERGDRWVAANDDANVARTGRWDWNSHRYAADSALATAEVDAALELTFRGRALVLSLDTLTPPNNYGPPELGDIDVFFDGQPAFAVRPRESANEVTLLRSDVSVTRRVRLVHRASRSGVGVRIRGFRFVSETSGDLAFVVSGGKNGALIDGRAILSRDGVVVRDTLVRNWLTGYCRLAGLLPGDGYALEIRASGWKTFQQAGITITAGEEASLPAIYLPRERDVGQDEVTFPSFGYAAVRRPGGSFRTRFEGQRAEIGAVRLVRRQGPAILSRTCTFEEDKAAAFYYHREGTVSIPAGTPPGTYDLEITMSDQRRTRTLTSPRAVCVVTTFPADPTFVSWGHLDTWGQYQAEYVGRLVAIANLLAPDMVLVSNEANPAYAAGALYGLEMPFVINFGNHRGPDPGPWFGKHVGAVDFGSAFTVLNFGTAWDHDTSEADALLAARESSRVKIINAFESNAPIPFLDRHGVTLIHYAHGPGPAVAKLGGTPTIRVGKSSSESFRVIRFKDRRPASYTYREHATAPFPFARGAEPPVGMAYQPSNDGTHTTVTATFHNDFEESFPDARAVFIMPRGEYRVVGGQWEHAFESDDAKFTIVTARFTLPAKSNGQIRVEPATE